jgi:hypothetical protein
MTSQREVKVPARTQGLIARDLGDEIVVLDPKTQQAHRLTDRDAEAWRVAGSSSPDERLAPHVARLQALGLVEARGVSRRQLLARAGAAAAAAPLASLALPMAQAAASITGIVVNSFTTGAGHTITSINYTISGTGNDNYTVTFGTPTSAGVTGTSSKSGKISNSTSKDTATTSGTLTATGSGNFTVNWFATDTSDNTSHGGSVTLAFP